MSSNAAIEVVSDSVTEAGDLVVSLPGVIEPRPSSNPYAIHLEFFSGPLDLLLHLVRQKEVQIEEVEMAGIAEQYLRIIASSVLIDLESASEYLVIAATLLAIKSGKLLPNEDRVDNEGGAEELGEGFYEELRERLKQYEQTQARARTLVEVAQLDVDVFVRRDRSAVATAPTDIENGQDPLTLAQGFFRLLKRIGASMRTIRIHLEPISIVSYMMKVVDKARSLIASKSSTSFGNISISLYSDELARGGVAKGETRRAVVIGSFIAVLELAKRGMVSVMKDPLSNAFSIGVRQEDAAQAGELMALSEDIEGEWSDNSDQPKVSEESIADVDTQQAVESNEIQESLPLIELEGNDKVVIMSRYRKEKLEAEKREAELSAVSESIQAANEVV